MIYICIIVLKPKLHLNIVHLLNMLYLMIYFLGFEISMVHMHEHKHIWWTSNLHGSIRMSHML